MTSFLSRVFGVVLITGTENENRLDYISVTENKHTQKQCSKHNKCHTVHNWDESAQST